MDRSGFYAVVIFFLFIRKSFSSLSETSNGTKILANRQFAKTDFSVLTSFIDISLHKCMKECEKKPRCTAANYIYRAKYCRLYTRNGGVIVFPGSLVITGLSENELCGDQMCKEKETCDSTTNTCIVKECGFPGKEMNSNGNLFSVGSKFMYTCAGDSETLTCTADGSWQNVKRLFDIEGITCKDMGHKTGTVQSGVYRNSLGMNIFCDFEAEGGDWMVLQRRTIGAVQIDFNRTWLEYKDGFGDICGEYWLGLDKIQKILVTKGTEFELRVEMLDTSWLSKFAVYDNFMIGPKSDGYRLHVGHYSGTAGNALNDESLRNKGHTHNGQIFSTWDKNDHIYIRNCTGIFRGGWWYMEHGQCSAANLNWMHGRLKGIWRDPRDGPPMHKYDRNHFLIKVSMKFREK